MYSLRTREAADLALLFTADGSCVISTPRRAASEILDERWSEDREMVGRRSHSDHPASTP
jgi:hypothetical protein